MNNWLDRTQLLIGIDAVNQLSTSHVLVAGLGGVGAYAAEMICRAGVGELTIVDSDCISNSNRNRQLLALCSTVGQSKTSLMAQRLLDINPNLKIHVVDDYLNEDNISQLFNTSSFDYVVDAIDTIAPKVSFIHFVLKQNLKLISAMGAGGKLDPSKIAIAEIEKSTQCKLAFQIRKRLHQLGVRSGFKAVYSTEIVPKHTIKINEVQERNKLTTVGTISYMPAMFGCYVASEVIRALIAKDNVTNLPEI